MNKSQRQSGITHYCMMAALMTGLVVPTDCTDQQLVEISIQPRLIIAGLGDVDLTVKPDSMVSGAYIRVDGRIYPTGTAGSNTLICTLPRADTLPVDIEAPARTATVELVDASGQPLSKTAGLAILRDYMWSGAVWIADIPHPEEMTVLQTGTGGLVLLCRNDRSLHLAVSHDGGWTWETVRDFFNLASRYDSFYLVPRDGGIHRLFVHQDGAVSFYDLAGMPAEVSPHRLPWTEGCTNFRAFRDNGGRLHMIWDYKVYAGRSRISYAHSDDLGENWSEPALVLDDPGDWPFYAGINGLAAHNGTHVFISYVVNHGRYQFDNGMRSGDGGLTWVDGTPLDWKSTVFCVDDSIIRLGRAMYLPYMYRPFISRSTDGGVSWTPVFDPEPELYRAIGWIASDPWGNLLCELTVREPYKKAVMRSFDNGAGWIVPEGETANLPPGHALTRAVINDQGVALLFSSSAESEGIRLSRGLARF